MYSLRKTAMKILKIFNFQKKVAYYAHFFKIGIPLYEHKKALFGPFSSLFDPISPCCRVFSHAFIASHGTNSPRSSSIFPGSLVPWLENALFDPILAKNLDQ